jgi:hypothetical protein
MRKISSWIRTSPAALVGDRFLRWIFNAWLASPCGGTTWHSRICPKGGMYFQEFALIYIFIGRFLQASAKQRVAKPNRR